MSRIINILITAVLLSTVPGFPARAAELNIVPSNPVVAVDSTFSVYITLNLDGGAGEQLAGGIIDLGYDEGLVEILDIAIDPYWDFLPDPGSKTAAGLWEDTGFDAFVNPPVVGNTVIAAITLEARAAGTSQLAVLPSSQFFSATAAFSPALTGALIRVNTPPVADDRIVVTDEDTVVPVTLSGSDDDGDDLTYAVVTGPAHGALSGSAPNLAYTPNLNFNGSDSFTFQVSDGAADSNTATVTITVTPVNDPPMVGDIPDQAIFVGSSFATIYLDELVNDVDNPDAEIIWQASGQSELTVSIVNRQASIEIPSPDWSGIEHILFMATDSGMLTGSDAAEFEVNDPGVRYVDLNSSCGGKTPCFSQIQAAIETTPTGETIICVTNQTYSENITLNRPDTTISLSCGWDENFTNVVSSTTLRGTFEIANGVIVFENLILQP